MEPATNRFALWQLAFRPGFLGAASLAVVGMVVWLLVLEGAFAWNRNYPAHWWHAHEMLFGFAMPVVVGFALTAVATWTGTKGTTGGRLLALFACWLAAISPHDSAVLPVMLVYSPVGSFAGRTSNRCPTASVVSPKLNPA